jgi:hypothetical protein
MGGSEENALFKVTYILYVQVPYSEIGNLVRIGQMPQSDGVSIRKSNPIWFLDTVEYCLISMEKP